MSFVDNANLPGIPHLMLKIVKLGGISKQPNDRYRSVPLFATFLLMIAVPKLFFGYSDFESTIIGVAELLFQINNFLGYQMYVLQTRKIYRLIRCSQSFVDDVLQETGRNIIDYLTAKHNLIHKASKLYLVALFIAVNFYILSPLILTLWSYYNPSPSHNNTVLYHLHMEENFYNLPIRTSLLEYLLFSFCMILTCYVCAYVGGCKLVTTFNLISYCSIYFRLVAMKIDLMAQANFIHSARRYSSLVRMHQKALRCAKLLESLLAPVVLLQLILCVLIWSFMLLYFTVSGFSFQFGNLLILFAITTLESFACCYLGSQLSTQSAKVGQAVFESNWERHPPRTVKNLQLIMLRSQKRVGLTAGKFCFVDMERFGKLVNTTYSVYVVLKDQL